MKIKSTLVVLFSILLLSNLYAQDNYKKLQQKVDSLETKLEEIYLKQITNNPYATGKTFDWGSGFFIGTKMGTHYTMNIEIGYIYKLRKNPFAFFSDDYIGKRKDYRLGISAGMQMFENELLLRDNLTAYQSSGYGAYMKLNFGSPVLLNFISFSGHIKAMYTSPDKNPYNTDNRMVLGYGNDIEFWLTDNECISIGYTDESDAYSGKKKKNQILPLKVRFVFGFKMFF